VAIALESRECLMQNTKGAPPAAPMSIPEYLIQHQRQARGAPSMRKVNKQSSRWQLYFICGAA
jgi:hypothetical protein